MSKFWLWSNVIGKGGGFNTVHECMLDVVYQLVVLLHAHTVFARCHFLVRDDELKHMTHSTHEFAKISLEVELRQTNEEFRVKS